jgi:hypothetical protein
MFESKKIKTLEKKIAELEKKINYLGTVTNALISNTSKTQEYLDRVILYFESQGRKNG